MVDPITRQKVGASDDIDVIYEQIENFDVDWVKPAKHAGRRRGRSYAQFWPKMIATSRKKRSASWNR